MSGDHHRRRRVGEDEDEDDSRNERHEHEHDGDDVQILVCTGNLGNAQPDFDSVAAWIPADGRCRDVLKVPQKYPVVEELVDRNESEATANATNATTLNFREESYTEYDQFDIIVLGMQEATFEPPSPPPSTGKKTMTNNKKETPRRSASSASSAAGGGGEGGGVVETSGISSVVDDNGDDKGGVKLTIDTTGSDNNSSERDNDGEYAEEGVAKVQASFRDSLLHFNIPVVTPIHKGLTKGVQRTVRGVNALTANKDYTKQPHSGIMTSNVSLLGNLTGNANASNKGKTRASSTLSLFTAFDIDRSQWDSGTQYLHRLLFARLPSYQQIVSFQRGEMRLEIFVRSPEIGTLDVEVVNVAAQNTGRAGLANKGGIVAELLVNGRTRLSFMTAHLEAHEGSAKYQMRCSSIADILAGTKSTRLHDISLTSHYSFVMGDLNFRTELPPDQYESEEDHKAKVRNLALNRDFKSLNEIDELHRALRNKDCLVGFQTLPCNFPPTFKVERKHGFEYIEKRRPSYTDRILWKNGHKLRGVTPLVYESVDDYVASDHKPVRAAFAVPINPTLRMRPRLARTHRGAVDFSSLFSASGSLGGLRRRMGSGAGNKKKKATSPQLADKNKLYLFVSSLKCTINMHPNGTIIQEAIRTGFSAPSPYVMLVSYPEEAIKQRRSFWNKLKSVARISHVSSAKRADGSTERTAFGWPRSSKRRHTCTPDWGGEEIPCKVQTHGADGAPLDLTGSMLRITVVDDNVKGDDPVIGSFAFNLANLLRRCIRSDGCASERDVTNPRRPDDDLVVSPVSQDQNASDNSRRRDLRQRRSLSRRGQMSRRGSAIFRGVFGNKSVRGGHFDVNEVDGDDDDEDPIVSANVDEPLVKNGKEVGRIQCTIDAWWMNQETARTISTLPLVSGQPLRQQQQFPVLVGANGKEAMLSARHHQRKGSSQHSFGSGGQRSGPMR